ncbi:hypothetical protein GCM10022409_07180 [Hymenobacter glaciei]|uniref:Lipocalin-like domain-containing protein n=1 Tax=Hymenobacter glaciei TaxID=877209 RepID=A0ABP7TGG4_9BACT
MRIPNFFAYLLPLALLGACQKHKPAVVTSSPTSMKQLEGTWLASHEETHGDTLVYRPNTYTFPPARGRTGFALKAYGRFEQFDIAPTDGLAGRPGTWTPDGKSRLRIHLTDGQSPDYTLEILSLHKQVLKLRQLP